MKTAVGMLSNHVEQPLRKSFKDLVKALEIPPRLHMKHYVIGIHIFSRKDSITLLGSSLV